MEAEIKNYIDKQVEIKVNEQVNLTRSLMLDVEKNINKNISHLRTEIGELEKKIDAGFEKMVNLIQKRES